jgi:hypothetical protein
MKGTFEYFMSITFLFIVDVHLQNRQQAKLLNKGIFIKKNIYNLRSIFLLNFAQLELNENDQISNC